MDPTSPYDYDPDLLDTELMVDHTRWMARVFGMCTIHSGWVSFDNLDVPDTKVWYLVHVSTWGPPDPAIRVAPIPRRKLFTTILTDGEVYLCTRIRQFSVSMEMGYQDSKRLTNHHNVVYAMRPHATFRVVVEMAIARYNAKLELQ